jgi:hypothetical protein
MDLENKPSILTVQDMDNGLVAIEYNTAFSIKIANAQPEVMSVVLVAPTAVTHSFNTNQRVIRLRPDSWNADTSTAVVIAPLDANVAPPQAYMLFVINGKTYSRARWVRLS